MPSVTLPVTSSRYPGADPPSIVLTWSDGELMITGDAGGHPLEADAADRLIEALQRARRAAFGLPAPSAVTLEVVEAGREREQDGPGTLILPNTVLLNGAPVYTQDGIRIHEATIRPPKGLAAVTITLPVRLLVVGHESDLPLPAPGA